MVKVGYIGPFPLCDVTNRYAVHTARYVVLYRTYGSIDWVSHLVVA